MNQTRRFDFWLWFAVALYVANMVGWGIYLIRRAWTGG